VANAVVDGTDALMLSAETAIGHDPALTVRTMARIAERAEQHDVRREAVSDRSLVEGRRPTSAALTAAMAHAARRAASELELGAIVCCTRTGVTARAMAALRPPCRLIGASPSPETTRQLALSWGVKPLVVGEYRTTDEMVRSVVESAAQHGLVHTGDTIGILAGSPTAPAGGTDVLRIVVVA
jgi:pyruvate kinase